MKTTELCDGLDKNEIQLVSKYFDLTEGSEPLLSLWIVGRPASGKTTIATLLHHTLSQAGYRVELVDGDVMRSMLSEVDSFSAADRLSVFKKYVYINRFLQCRGIIPITATIGGLSEYADIVRKNLKNPRFIHLDCPIDVAARRDQKGHYSKALAGKLENFIGIDIPYEPPTECEMVIDSAGLKPTVIAANILEHLGAKGLLREI
jgi:adenylylsulfate kinase-like enzyme